jgi:homeobox protein ESX1
MSIETPATPQTDTPGPVRDMPSPPVVPPDQDQEPPVREPPGQPGAPPTDPTTPPEGDPPRPYEPTRLVSSSPRQTADLGAPGPTL